ncbi:hypothetical protein [Streptomyces sp. NPDC088180]|uniref:hypothetical protein n=1 Tax=Streptomyces sp. NPDC088180 TaxID=3365837 RepID=UPI0037FB5F5D
MPRPSALEAKQEAEAVHGHIPIPSGTRFGFGVWSWGHHLLSVVGERKVPVLERFQGDGPVAHLLGDPVDVFGDRGVHVDSEGFAVARAHAGHRADEEAEGVAVAGRAQEARQACSSVGITVGPGRWSDGLASSNWSESDDSASAGVFAGLLGLLAPGVAEADRVQVRAA